MTNGEARTATTPPPTRPNRLGVKRWTGWFVIGLLTAFGLQFLQVQALGETWDSLLLVGSSSKLRPIIESELGPVFLEDSTGHDGQFSFVTGLDPDGSDYADVIPDGGYRWRRILYPALAGFGGLLGGKGLLVSLTVWAALGMGLASASVVDIGQSLGLRRWVAIGVLANPGIWFSVQLLTSDALAVGLALLGVSLVLRRNRLAWVFLAGAVLAKDQYLIIALAIVGYLAWHGDRRRALLLLVGATLPLALWTLFLDSTVGGAAGASGNLAWPVAGITKGIGRWSAAGTDETVLGLLALAFLALAAIAPWFTKRRILRFLALPWVALAIVLSHWVWQAGNNAVRVLLPLSLFGVMAVVAALDERGFGGDAEPDPPSTLSATAATPQTATSRVGT